MRRNRARGRAERADTESVPRNAPRPRLRGRVCTALGLVLALALAATAQALPDAGEDTGVDTPYTPRAKKPSDSNPVTWSYVSGARYDETREQYEQRRSKDGLPVPWEVNFHDVSFRVPQRGFAVGSEEQGDVRVPIVYRFSAAEGWQRDQSFEGQGYIAQIAWLDDKRALAVGGDGSYPHREAPETFCTPEEELPYEDPTGAGLARVWLYEDGSWRELERGKDFPDEIGALTALDAYDTRDELPRYGDLEFAVAGGLCQLWHWSGDSDGEGPGSTAGFLRAEDGSGKFEAPYTPATEDPQKVENPQNLAYRVRSVAFATYVNVPEEVKAEGTLGVSAATSGCCGGETLAAMLSYDADVEPGDASRGRWSVRADTRTETDDPTLVPDSVYSITRTRHFTPDDPTTGGSTPDPKLSTYQGVILTPGGAPPDLQESEPASRIRGIDEEPLAKLQRNDEIELSSLRLHGGDGDIGGAGCEGPPSVGGISSLGVPKPPPGACADDSTGILPPLAANDGSKWEHFLVSPGAAFQTPLGGERSIGRPDGLPDWAAGQLSENGRGVIVGTDPNQLPPPSAAVEYPGISAKCKEVFGLYAVPPKGTEEEREYYLCRYVNPIPNWALSEKTIEEYKPVDPDRAQAALLSYKLLAPGTSALNAVDVLDREQAQRVGWAVGDRGALVKMGSGKAETSGASRTALGGGRSSPPESSPYDGHRPPIAGEPQRVPPRAPSGGRSEPELVTSSVVSNEVRGIAMSRDGSEGWAVGGSTGSFGAGAGLFHFDGNSWRECEIQGVQRITKPDPACSELHPLAADDQKIAIVAIARVPLENDPDPTNDDEFEAVAIPSDVASRKAILRFRKGRWKLEPVEGAVLSTLGWDGRDVRDYVGDLAFTAPDDGWFLSREATLFHFGGSSWQRCGNGNGGTDTCGDGETKRHIAATIGLDLTVRRTELIAVGERVYLAGTREVSGQSYPFITYKDRGVDGWYGGKDTTDDGRYNPADTGHDPSYVPPGEEESQSPSPEPGDLRALGMVRRADGSYRGWAMGSFGRDSFMRLGGERAWIRFDERGALKDFTAGKLATHGQQTKIVASPNDSTGSVVATTGSSFEAAGDPRFNHLYAFDEKAGQFELIPSPRPAASLLAAAPDGSGGAWSAVMPRTSPPRTYFFHYTDRPAKPVFSETPNPVATGRRQITDLAGLPDGTLWASTDSGTLHRYDRLTGWDRVPIPGWDPGRIVTTPSPANALSVGLDGEGVVVGRGGRVARFGPQSVALDPAAGVPCAQFFEPPCATTQDLLAAEIAPDGSVLIGGENATLLWAPPGGELQRIPVPEGVGSNLRALAIADQSRIWIGTAEGKLYAGTRGHGAGWSWRLENEGPDGALLSLGEGGEPLGIHAMALDRQGRGYAVGDEGLILKRRGDGAAPWHRVDSGFRDSLTAVALPVGGGPGALVAGAGGLVLTKTQEGAFALAHPGEFPHGQPNARVRSRSAVLLPGITPGQAEGWVALRVEDGTAGPGVLAPANPSRLLHYLSDPAEPLLDPSRGASALSDTAGYREGELSFAAFGKSDCRRPTSKQCGLIAGTNELSEVIKTRVTDELVAEVNDPNGPRLALFTGSAVDSVGLPASNEGRATADLGAAFFGEPAKLHSWRASVADRLASRGLPLLGAIGSQDLSVLWACDLVVTSSECVSTKQHAKAGDNLAWRQEFSDMPAPWGSGEEVESGSLRFEPVGDADLSLRHEDVEVEDSGVEAFGRSAPTELRTGGAATHYAVDVIDASREENEAVARIVFVDSSFRSLSASDPIQQPFEPDGQLQWLEKMLCIRGEANLTHRCDREPHQQAIVVSTTPPYSYGPGTGSETATDSTAFEAVLMKHRVGLLVTGRIGWNGLYWATAPGVHVPCPGGDYRTTPPEPGTRACGQGADLAADPSALVPATRDVSNLAGETAQPALDETVGSALGELLPTVVASGAGGKLANEGGSASEGFWWGYTIVRLSADGDPRNLIVEQRPVYDWVAIQASERVLSPNEKLTLEGYARSPVGVEDRRYAARFDRIDSPAVTHRYDLLLADPEAPWVPCEASDEACVGLAERLAGSRSFDSAAASGSGSAQDDKEGCEPYVCLPKEVATIDSQSGALKAGNGKYPDTFAIGMLSVGDHVATYPLYFKRSPSFVVNPVSILPEVPAVPAGAGSAPPVPNPPNPPTPDVPQPTAPQTPALPGVPPIAAAQPPEPQPPAPPLPPPPTEQPSPLNLALAPPSIAIATPTAVIQPPTPPVNPAPPGGARREARQRQAAAQKSGADNAEGGNELSEAGGDQASAPPGPQQSMTRLDHSFTSRRQSRPEPSFTSLARASDGVSAGQALVYTGGITLLAAALALGWNGVRPTPRRTPPEVPAAAWARARGRR